jgi:hypothetical protein
MWWKISNTKNCGFNGARCDSNCSTLIPIICSSHCVQFIYFLWSFHISPYVLYSFYLNYWAHEEQKMYAAVNLRKPALYSGCCYLKCFRLIVWHFCFNVSLTVHLSITLDNDQLDAQIFLLIHLLRSSMCTCFKQYLAHPQEVRLY